MMRLVVAVSGSVMESNSCDVMLAITQSAVCLRDQLITPQSARQLISDTASVFVCRCGLSFVIAVAKRQLQPPTPSYYDCGDYVECWG